RADDEGEPELVALHPVPQRPQRPPDAYEREHRDDQQPGRKHLADDAEHGQDDDDVVRHGRTFSRGSAYANAVNPMPSMTPDRKAARSALKASAIPVGSAAPRAGGPTAAPKPPHQPGGPRRGAGARGGAAPPLPPGEINEKIVKTPPTPPAASAVPRECPIAAA